MSNSHKTHTCSTVDTAHVPRLLASTLQLEFAHTGGTGQAESQQKRRMSLLAMTHAQMGVRASPLTQPSRTPPPPLMRPQKHRDQSFSFLGERHCG